MISRPHRIKTNAKMHRKSLNCDFSTVNSGLNWQEGADFAGGSRGRTKFTRFHENALTLWRSSSWTNTYKNEQTKGTICKSRNSQLTTFHSPVSSPPGGSGQGTSIWESTILQRNTSNFLVKMPIGLPPISTRIYLVLQSTPDYCPPFSQSPLVPKQFGQVNSQHDWELDRK